MCPEEDGGCGDGAGGVSAAATTAAAAAAATTLTSAAVGGAEGSTAASAAGSAAETSALSELRSWWEVPAIAHFCSLFRTAFRLPDFEIEVSSGSEGKGSSAVLGRTSRPSEPPAGLSPEGEAGGQDNTFCGGEGGASEAPGRLPPHAAQWGRGGSGSRTFPPPPLPWGGMGLDRRAGRAASPKLVVFLIFGVFWGRLFKKWCRPRRSEIVAASVCEQ